jgi:hypothetical protein
MQYTGSLLICKFSRYQVCVRLWQTDGLSILRLIAVVEFTDTISFSNIRLFYWQNKEEIDKLRFTYIL